MKNNKIFYILILSLILLFGVSAVNSAEIEESSNQTDESNFTEFNDIIQNTRDTVSLSRNYSYMSGDDNIDFHKSMTVDGQNHTIDLNGKSGVFMINNDMNLTFKSIIFENMSQFTFNDSNKFYLLNITFIDCNFSYNMTDTDNEIREIDLSQGILYSGSIPYEVSVLAKSIVGNAKGVDAAKLLANWVNKHIRHESRAGFYQSTSETLKRKKGNCCAHTELFLQMCEVVGLTQYHTLSIVHVGTMEFGHRHFFALFDNICVDTDRNFDDPWGRGGMGNRMVRIITDYPMLPIARTY